MAVEKARYAASIYLTPADLSQYPGPSTSLRYSYVKSLDALFAWATNDTSTIDNTNVIGASGGASGRWKRIGGGDGTDTRASTQALSSPSHGRVVYVAEVDASYKFDSSSSATSDSWTVLTANDSTPGRWVLQGGPLSLTPIGGTSDDWPRLIGSAGVACAAAGIRLVARAGTWLCKSVQSLPSSLMLEFAPGASIVCSLGSTGNQFNAPFSGPPVIAGTTTLAANPTFGSRTFSITGNVGGALAAGKFILVLKPAGFRASLFKVESVSGSGPYTVTVDRPIRRTSLASGDTVNVYTSIPKEIRITGNGVQVTGTYDRCVEMSPVWRCVVKGLTIVSPSNVNDLLCSFDIGGYGSKFEDIDIDGFGTTRTLGIALESNDHSSIVNCTVKNLTSYGIALYDCVDCDLIGSTSSNNQTGIAVTGDGTTTGCLGCVVSDCRAIGNSQNGLSIANGSSECVYSNCQANYNTVDGIILDGGTGSPTDNAFINCFAKYNGLNQIVLTAGALSTRFVGCYGSRSVSFAAGWNIGASCSLTNCGTIKGIVSEGDTGILVAAGTVVMSGCQFTPYYGFALSVSSGAKVVADSSVFSTTDVTNPVATISGSATFSGCRFESGGTGLNIATTGAARIDSDVDLSGVTTAFAIAGSGTLSAAQSGSVSKAFSGSDITLTFTEGLSGVLRGTGSPGAGRNLIVPTVSGMAWDASNEFGTAQTMTVKTSGGTGIAIAQNKRARVMCDGTNVVRISPDT